MSNKVETENDKAKKCYKCGGDITEPPTMKYDVHFMIELPIGGGGTLFEYPHSNICFSCWFEQMMTVSSFLRKHR